MPTSKLPRPPPPVCSPRWGGQRRESSQQWELSKLISGSQLVQSMPFSSCSRSLLGPKQGNVSWAPHCSKGGLNHVERCLPTARSGNKYPSWEPQEKWAAVHSSGRDGELVCWPFDFCDSSSFPGSSFPIHHLDPGHLFNLCF